MGPQHFCCGKSLHFQNVPDIIIASMGPQHFCCGKTSSLIFTRSIDQLQWGRSISAAESILRREPWCQTPRFNGAAAFLLRKEHVEVEIFLHFEASMGPQHFCCGKAGLYNVNVVGTTRFNGAAAFLLRKVKTP